MAQATELPGVPPKAFSDSLFGNHSPQRLISSSPGKPKLPVFQLFLALGTKAGDFGPIVTKEVNQVWLSLGLCVSSLRFGTAGQSDS